MHAAAVMLSPDVLSGPFGVGLGPVTGVSSSSRSSSSILQYGGNVYAIYDVRYTIYHLIYIPPHTTTTTTTTQCKLDNVLMCMCAH